LLLQGLILGFSIAAPVGPIGVLCIRRTLAEGRLTGFLSGLGAATADMLYGAIAAFGLTAIMNLLVDQQSWLRAVGGLFLLYLGIRTFLTKPSAESAPSRGMGWLSAYVSTFFLTVTNPMTILSFIGMFSAILPTDGASSAASSVSLVLGVFLGSAAWWLALSGLVSLFRERFTPAWMQLVNRVSGVVITVFAIIILAGWVN
ncbi:MAG TPA: LysE family transporter, partial [Anaerolineales bacterium]|nr:LysE family transporter [Anaerolineales bacterium]